MGVLPGVIYHEMRKKKQSKEGDNDGAKFIRRN